jgi:hypothetical protein
LTDTRGRGLLHVQIDIDPPHLEEFNRWYNEEHFPAISSFWGVLEGRRFIATDNPHRFLAYYDLKSPDVLNSPDYEKVRSSPWTERISKHFTFRQRTVYTDITPQLIKK